MEENNETKINILPAEKIPDGFPTRAWINKKNKKIRWTIENSNWVKKFTNPHESL